jgi:type I restriction enzyme S subunit
MKKGWEKTKLGDVCVIDKAQGVHRKLPYVGLEQIESHTARFLGSIQPQAVKSSTFRFSENHVLYGRLRPYLNKALAPDFEGHCSTEIFPFKPNAGLSREFLLYWFLMESTMERINGTCTGARMPRANMNEVLGFDFLLPPFAEQQRIVGLLDEAFEGIATAKANAEKNLQNARALFESHLQSVFSQRGKGWVEKPFEDCIEDVKYTTKIQRKEFLEEGDFPIVSQEADFTNGYWNNAADVFKIIRPVVIFGDHTQVLKYIDFDFVLGADGVKLLPPKPFLNPKFFFYALRSAPLKSLGYARHYRLLKELQIGYPDMNAQVAISKKLDALREETQRLASLYTRKLAALEALKKSLLHQAFSGEL